MGANQSGADLSGAVTVRGDGTMLWNLHHNISVEMTLDKAIRVVNADHNIVLALSAGWNTCAMLHTLGAIYADQNCVHVTCFDLTGKADIYAKIKSGTIVFSSEKTSIHYKLDEGGARTVTKETFKDLFENLPSEVFLKGSKIGWQYQEEVKMVLENIRYRISPIGTQMWAFDDIIMEYSKNGHFSCYSTDGKYDMSTNIFHSFGAIKTPFVYTRADRGPCPDLFARQGDLTIFYDTKTFQARTKGHFAGFDEDNNFKTDNY